MELTDRISELLDQKYKEDENFQDCFTIEIELKPGNKLNVFVDADSGINFGKCQQLSRYLESHLDTNGWLGERYVLEVSSPGLSRPLRFFRQYHNNVGRNVETTLKDGTVQKGKLIAAEEQQITLSQEKTEKQGKKKTKVTVETRIAFEDIEKTLIKPSFK